MFYTFCIWFFLELVILWVLIYVRLKKWSLQQFMYILYSVSRPQAFELKSHHFTSDISKFRNTVTVSLHLQHLSLVMRKVATASQLHATSLTGFLGMDSRLLDS